MCAPDVQAGAEQFTSMVELYIQNCQGFILVYDVTRKTTFGDLDSLYEKVVSIKGRDAIIPMAVVGNKADDDSQREVILPVGFQKAKSWNASFFETSAKTQGAKSGHDESTVSPVPPDPRRGPLSSPNHARAPSPPPDITPQSPLSSQTSISDLFLDIVRQISERDAAGGGGCCLIS